MAHATITTIHMAHLGRLLSSHILELGPAAGEVPDEHKDTVVDQLTASGFLTDPETLSPSARGLLEPLTAYDEAYTGLIILHNQRQPLTFNIDDEWFDFLKQSFSDIPRVYFLIARQGQTVTIGIRSGEQISLTQEPLAGLFPQHAATSVLGIGDPQKKWDPADITPASFPVSLLEHAPLRRPADDVDNPDEVLAYRKQTDKFTTALRAQGISTSTAATLRRLLSFDHVAVTHVAYSAGHRKLLSEGSATVDYFHNAGVAISSLRKTPDGSVWKAIHPASPANVSAALTDLTHIPASPRGSHIPQATRN